MASQESRHLAAAAQPLDNTKSTVDPLIGPLLADRYRLSKLLGEGGMGRVYLGEHTLMRKRVAFKVLHKELTQMPEVVARFEREAMAAANIEHPNIASATDFGKLPDGSVFLVLEYVQGTCLRTVIEEGPLPVARALHIARQIASAVAAAHALRIIHRDLKPENVLLVEKNGDVNFVKVLDFGIAKVPVQEVSERGSIRPAKVITRVGMIFGTPEYMAPEQALGQYVDVRADLYAMGVMLFEMLCGKRPFSAENPIGILGQQLQGVLPSFAQRVPGSKVPPILEQMIQRLLAPAPASRLASAQALIAALDELQTLLVPRTNVAPGDAPVSPRFPDSSTAAIFGRLPVSERAAPAVTASMSNAQLNAPTVPAPTAGFVKTTGKQTSEETLKASRPGTRNAKHSRALLLGLSGALLVGFAALALLAGRPLRKAPRVAQPSASVIQAPAASLEIAPVQRVASEADLTAAKAEGLNQLRELATRFPNDPRLLVELAKAQFAQGNSGDCLDTIQRAYSLDATVSGDANLATLLWKIVQKRELTERALHMLETGYGERGVDILYDLSTIAAVREDLRQAAATRLKTPEVLNVASPALRVLLSLQQANTCLEKKALLPNIEREADGRIIPELKAMQSMAGCGKHGRYDCNPCLRHGLELENAIAAVKNRP
jgi:eukaryotic-like serine/threonine-protein kinase